MLKRYFFSFILISILMTPVVHAARFTLVGAANQSTYVSSSVTGTPKMAIGGGLLLEFPMGLEIDALYLPRSYTAGSETLKFNIIQLPVIYRMRFAKVLSLGFGGYFSKFLGTPVYNGSASTYSAISMTENDFGVLGLAGLSIPLGILTKFVIEGRYTFGLSNVSKNTAVTAKFNDLQLMAGFAFGM